MQSPSRPFESLDWYRDASRRRYRRRGPLGQAVSWLKSARAFAFHIGLFALGCTIAFAWNVAREPADLWVDRLALAWLIVLVIHAAIAILFFMIGLIGGSEPELPAYQPRPAPPSATYPESAPPPFQAPNGPSPSARAGQAAASTWGPPPSPARASTQTTPHVATTTAGLAATRGWANWSQTSRNTGWGAPRAGDSETASWSETSPGAMIRRHRMRPSTEPPAPAPAPSTTEEPGSDA